MNGGPSGRNERRLREKQQEPCAGDDAVRNDQWRVWRIPPGLVND
jgi:hypothetical protein